MKFSCVIIAIVLCTLAVEGRHFHQQNEDENQNENIDLKHSRSRPERRMRSRRQSYYNNYHDYVNPFQNVGVGDFLKDILYSVREIESHVKQGGISRFYPNYYDNRRDYSNKCEDSLKELLTLYRELATQLKQSPPPPPPPQIIYIPYPVPATFNHPVDKMPSNVNITDRNKPADRNQIWMDTPKNMGTEDDDDDGSRPVSFKPVQPKRPHVTPPPFEHGSSQAGISTTPLPLKKPGACEAAVLSCCGSKTEQEQENCFALYNCSKSYKTGLACSSEVIKIVLDNFSKMYGPINEF